MRTRARSAMPQSKVMRAGHDDGRKLELTRAGIGHRRNNWRQRDKFDESGARYERYVYPVRLKIPY